MLLIVSVNAMSKWKGTFGECQWSNQLQHKIISKNQCLAMGGSWVDQNINFNNIGNCVIAFFFIIVGSDWIDILYSTIDSVDIDREPIYNYNPAIILLFYAFILFGSILLFNLFIGVVIDNFNQQREIVGGYLVLTAEQREWVDLQRFILRKKLRILITKPQNVIRAWCFEFIKKTWFHVFVGLSIAQYFFITVTVTSDMTEYHKELVQVVIALLIGLFHLELAVKFLGLGVFFFKDACNRFLLLFCGILNI